MPDIDLLRQPLTTTVAMVHRGEISPAELVELSLTRIRNDSAVTSIFVEIFEAKARAQARRLRVTREQPLAGLPIAIKNNRAVEGGLLTHGSNAMGDYRAEEEDVVVRRLVEAGAIIVGSSTLTEFAVLPGGTSARFGVTQNPFDPTLSSGGSSCGSAAAVAAGMVAFAHANDGAGSIRIPAALCGLVGVKTGRLLQTSSPSNPAMMSEGALTRSSADNALVLSVLDPLQRGLAWWGLGQSAARPMRVALSLKSPLARVVASSDAINAVRRIGVSLAAEGHDVVEDEPPWHENLATAFFPATAPALIARIDRQLNSSGLAAPRQRLEPYTKELLAEAARVDVNSQQRALDSLAHMASRVDEWMSSYDAVLAPVTPENRLSLEALTGASGLRETGPAVQGLTAFTIAANALGFAAGSFPVAGPHTGGPPGAVQVLTASGSEPALLAIGQQIERIGRPRVVDR